MIPILFSIIIFAIALFIAFQPTKYSITKSYKEYIVCSAIYYNDSVKREHQPTNILIGIVVCGLRHCNCFTILNNIFPLRDYMLNDSRKNTTQGFLTSFNRFVNRSEAYEIARQNKQCKPNKYKILASEDIY